MKRSLHLLWRVSSGSVGAQEEEELTSLHSHIGPKVGSSRVWVRCSKLDHAGSHSWPSHTGIQHTSSIPCPRPFDNRCSGIFQLQNLDCHTESDISSTYLFVAVCLSIFRSFWFYFSIILSVYILSYLSIYVIDLYRI